MEFQCKRCLSIVVKKDEEYYCQHCKESKTPLQIEEAPEIETYDEGD